MIQYLQERAQINDAALSRAQAVSDRTGAPVEQVLNQLGSLSDDHLAAACAHIAECDVWDPKTLPIGLDPALLGVSIAYLRRARMAPLLEDQGYTVFATCDPLDEEAIAGLVFATGRHIKVLAARPGELARRLRSKIS